MLFPLILDNWLIPAIYAQIFNPDVELAIPTGKPTNEANTEVDNRNKNKKVLKVIENPTHYFIPFPH